MLDPMMLELFRAEVDTHGQALTEGLLALEKDPNQPKRLEGLMRAAHSIKGAARIVGLDRAVEVAHALEDCFVAAQKGQLTLTPPAIDTLLRGVDALTRISQALDQTADNAGLLAAIAAVRAGQTVAAGGKPPKADAPGSPPPAPPPPPVGVHGDRNRTTLTPAGALDAERTDRLRAALLDLLAQEVAVLRLDLAAVPDLGPPALTVLTALAARVRAEGNRRELEVINLTAPARAVLHHTGLGKSYRLLDPVGG
jgi:two-component system sensor histidine kinase and response regulator WspE